MHNYEFRYGFSIKGMHYGWYKKKLYRLPSMVNNRMYIFKEQFIFLRNNKSYYRLIGKKYSIKQLENITNPIVPIRINLLKSDDLPF